MTQTSQTTAVPAPRTSTEYDGYAPIHHCGCGCGIVIGDGDWAHGRRHHGATLPRELRYTAHMGLLSPRH